MLTLAYQFSKVFKVKTLFLEFIEDCGCIC